MSRLLTCAKIPAGLTSEQRAGVILTKHLMEGQYYPAPGGETSSYSEIAGGEELTPLTWTS